MLFINPQSLLFLLLPIMPTAVAYSQQPGAQEQQGGYHSGTKMARALRGDDSGVGRYDSDIVETIRDLAAHHDLINRHVTHYSNGTIVAETWSEDDQVTEWLHKHVHDMKTRVEEAQLVRSWDPFFVEMFERLDEFTLNLEETEDGVIAFSWGETDCGQSLAEAHALVVSLFAELGNEELTEAHDVPDACLVETESIDTDDSDTSDINVRLLRGAGM